jgi:hypothetical protein
MTSLGIGQCITPVNMPAFTHPPWARWTFMIGQIFLYFMDTPKDIWKRHILSTFLYAFRRIHLLLGRMTLIYYGISLSSTTSGCTSTTIRITKTLIGRQFGLFGNHPLPDSTGLRWIFSDKLPRPHLVSPPPTEPKKSQDRLRIHCRQIGEGVTVGGGQGWLG